VNSLCPKMDELCSYDVACVSLSNGERLVPQGFFYATVLQFTDIFYAL
jgi:hypothetical protein